MDNVVKFWEALGALTYEQTLEVSATIRDSFDTRGAALGDAEDWAALLNYARAHAQAGVV